MKLGNCERSQNLLPLDRGVIDDVPKPAWGTVSNVGLFSAIGFAALDPVISGYRDGVEAGIVDAIIYAESISVTWTLTNLAKISFRRPRPSAYRTAIGLAEDGECQPDPMVPDTPKCEITGTNSALSFFSGHAAITASVAATASYLAFSRDPNGIRPWITLVVGGAMAAVTSVARVQSGDHFPTDVIAGAMAGAGIGVMVPHLHRSEPATRRPVWIGAAPIENGGVVTASGLL